MADKTSSTLFKLIHWENTKRTVYFSTFKTIIKEMKKGKKLSVMSMSYILRFWNSQLIKLTEQSKIRRPHRLQNSRFRTFSEGAKRRKRDPRVWSARASLARRACKARKHGGQPYFFASLTILPRRFYTRSRPVVRIWSVARVRKKYDCFAV